MQKTVRVLIADDDEADRLKIARALKQAGPRYECVETTNIQDALRVCEQVGVDCAVIDYKLPAQNGLAGITDLHNRYPYLAIIMLTGSGDEMVAADAMKRGASDYLAKSKVDKRLLVQSIDRAVENANLRRLLAEQQEELHLFNAKVVHDFREPL
jgi:DNA-binding NtrC family response regulator